MVSRSLLLFQNTIKSKKTLDDYTKHLNRFIKFAKLHDPDELPKLSSDKIQELLEDYVIHLKKRVSPNSVPTYMNGVKHFCIVSRIRGIEWKIISKMYPARVKLTGYRAWTTKEVQGMLSDTTKKRSKFLIHFLASTGGRIGILDHDLQMKHLVDMQQGCKAVLLYAGFKEEYWAFLTPEAVTFLNSYHEERKKDGEHFTPESPIFRTIYTVANSEAKPLSSAAARMIIHRLAKSADTKRRKVSKTRYDVQADHGFRKRFNTILKIKNDVNSNIAEKIMGHSVTIPLDNTYLDVPVEKLFEEFAKAIPELTVSDDERQEMRILKLEKDKSELEKKQMEIEEMRETQARILRKLEKYDKVIPLDKDEHIE